MSSRLLRRPRADLDRAAESGTAHTCASPSMKMIARDKEETMTTTTEVFADVDRMDAKAFASHLAEDCLLRFGNADEVVGRDAIEEVIAGFFTTINGISHQIVDHGTSTTRRSFNSRPPTRGRTIARSRFQPSPSGAAEVS